MIKRLLLKYFLKHLHITVTKHGERIIDTGYGLLKSNISPYPFNTVVLSPVVSRDDKYLITFEVK